jgi:FkbM family methyltransferase
MKKFLQKIRTAVGFAKASPQKREHWRLSGMARRVATTTDLPGARWRIPDGPSFAASWTEIFEREIYRFTPSGVAPKILDCGANVGVSCWYFYRNFPGARITAFEPDPEIFACLQENLAASGCAGIELVPKAVWSADTVLQFQADGADGGRIEASAGGRRQEVPAVRLKNFLAEPVDLLKLDIEGAETEVLRDIAPALALVRNVFVEYHSFAGQQQTLGELMQILVAAGFRLHVHPVNTAPQPLVYTPVHLGMDMQLNIFARRESAS